MRIFDTFGGTILTHAAVGIGAFFVARGWTTADQAQSLAKEVANYWPAWLALAGGGTAAVAGKVATRND